MRNIYIIGASIVGADVAQACAQSGFEVILYDKDSLKLIDVIDRIDKSLEIGIDEGKLSLEDKNNIMGKIDISNDLYDAKKCCLVIEMGDFIENERSKIFSALDAICNKDTIFAYDGSYKEITKLSKALLRTERLIGIRFYTPILTMNVIGIIKGKQTSEDVNNKIGEFIKKLGRTPIEIIESSRTFQNAMLIPMINDAIECLVEGMSTKRDNREIFEKVYNTYSTKPFALKHLIEDLGDN